ncbi:hypothetical protein NESM_000417600 [Novymonas esmeraldas]|uniref:Uncharacterized protein n=1 Tax=Novymonas esmeraldas TaxID=1808958 RepID=A0AAW0EP25_9TRYP
MGCANEKLHGQQIAYQRDFLGACWNSSLGDDEANEFLASRWMGVSRQVMGLHTTNHCFVVRALSKEEKSSAAASVANPGGGAGAAPDDPTGAQPGLRGYVSAHLPTAGTGKTAADSGALRAVMKEAIELEKVIYNGHPYLQRHELSVHSGVVFRCAPARRLYHRLSFVAEARALSRGSAPPPQQEQQQQQQQQQKRRESPRTPLVVSSNEATPAGRSSNSSGGRTRSALTLHGSSGRRATQRDGDGAAAVGMPALRLGSAVARRGDWVTGDPLSEANNYPIEDRDVDGVVASQPPVVVASITAMELQALPPNAELCFGGWLYVSLQDEQERLRRSLERYDARRQRRSATATTATTAAAAALGAGASMVSSMWQSPSASLRDSPPLGPRGEGLRRHSARVDRSRRASVDGEDPFLRAAAAGRSMVAEQEQRQQRRRRSRRDNASEGDDDDEEDEDLSTRSRRLTAAAASTVLEEQEAEERQTRPLDATVAAAPEADTTPVEEAVLQQQQLDVQPRSSSATSSPPTMLAVAPSLESPTGAGGAGASPSPALSTPGRKRATSVPPPLLSTPTQHTGKYAQEAMEADALAAAWLPYAYIVVAVPMYECSIVPTSFHTALTRHKAVSLNLANTQSRQAYGVGCITAARYGGVTVVECREKINEDEDAEWVDELLRVGRAAEQRYGAAEARTNPASNSSTHAATAAASSRPGASYTARSRRPSRLMLHDARDEKLRRVKGRIWNKLHRQGLHVVLAATRTADLRQRQRSGAAADELGLTSASAGTPSRSTMFDTAAAMAPFSVEPVADGCSDCKGNPVADDKGVSRPSSSSNSSSSSSSSASSRGRSSASGAPRAGRTTRSDGDGSSHGLWTRLYRSEGRRHQRGDHRQHAGGGDRGAAVPLQVRRPWVEPGHRRDDDFLLRGTFRQIGGIKYMDAESLMDGCPVSELVHGLKRWVLNLLSMPIKARPLCLYLQRYEGIASSLRLLTTQLATTAVAATVASGRVIAPANLSFNLTGGALEDAATSFASPAQAEAMMGGGGGGASTGSFSAASVALANASFAAAAAMHTAPRGLQYNTYYRGPLDPVVRAVLSPEEEAMIAACQTRVLPPVLRAPEPAEAHLPVRSSGSGGDGHGGGGGRRTGGGSAGSAPAPSVLPSVSASVQSRRSARASATESSMLLHPGLQPDIDTTPHAAGEPRSVQPGAAVHADPDAPLPLPPTVEAATPQRSFAAPPPDAALVVPTTITECLLYDDPSLASVVGGGGGGSSFSAANGRALAAAAAALVLGGGIDRVSDGGVNGSFAAPLSGALSFAAPTVSGGGGADVDRLTPPPPQVDDSDGDGVTRVPGSGGADDGAEEGSACRRASPRGRQLLSDDDGDDDVVEDGAAAEESSNAERNWQLADRELRALKSELDEMHYLVATARGELLERLEEAIQLGALFLPHTRPDQVSLTLLTMKMLRQYPDEVPVKEIHTDWMPLLVALLTSSRDHLFCSCAAGGELEHRGTGAALGFLTTYNNVVAHADVCDANKRRQLHDAKTTKYTIDPLPPLPAPRPLHDIAIAPQPVRLSRAMLQEVKRVGMDATGLSFSFSGGSLGVLAGVLHYYADFLRAKYRSEVAAAGGQARDAGATVRDVLARGGFNVILRRVWVWGVSPESTRRRAPPPPPRGATALKKTRRLLQPRRRGRGDDADSTSSTESTAAAWAGEDADRVVTNTAGVVGGSVCSAGQPFRGAEAYALYDAVVYYLRVLEELHLEHHGDPSMAPTGPAKRRSVLMAWRRHKSGAGDAAAAAAAAAPATPAAADTSGAGDASDTAVELVPRFDICVATHYYYKTMLEEARQPRGPPRGSSSLAPAPHDGAQPATAPADARKRSDMKASSTPPPAAAVSRHARAAKAAEAQQAEWERPYCGGEEAMHDSAQQRRAVKKFFKFLTDHYEQWRARTGGGGGGGGDDGGNDRITAAALSKRVHITMK